MNKKQIEQWKETRAKGKARFILVNSIFYVFAFAIVLNISNLIFDYLFDPVRFQSRFEQPFGFHFVISLIFCLSLGLILSKMIWNATEKEFLKNFSAENE